MKIVLYCQHVLGIGHFFRTLELARAFAEHDVILVSGGPRIETPVPAHVRELRLPPLMMGRNFSNLYSGEQDSDVKDVKAKRRKLLFSLFENESPDLLIVELYPFGRKKFRFEIDPVIEGIRNGNLPECRVICSLRDVLVEKDRAEKYEARVIETVNCFFDALLIHADPELIRLDETFSRTKDISIPMIYTGFVTPKPEPGARERLRNQIGVGKDEVLVVASAGGGNVGGALLEGVLDAFGRIDTGKTLHLHMFSGPFMDDASFDRLKARSSKNIRVFRFTPDFLSYLSAADLSVSMAGYNTCMNVLAAGVPALVWPFSANREQRYRAERLARPGCMEVLGDDDIKPQRLSALMNRAISRTGRFRGRIDLDGAANTVKWVEMWMEPFVS
ncbi:MAG: glycosyltransferase [Pseudomonadota bacterium]